MRLAERAVRGAVAGVVGTVIMDAVTTALYEHQSAAVTERETAAMPNGKGAAEMAAIKTAAALGLALSDDQSKRGASLFHWAVGVVPAAIFYGLAGDRLRSLGPVRGLIFGVGLFAAVDEGVNTALGFAASPRAYPIETHMRGLLGHVVLGAATDAVYSLID